MPNNQTSPGLPRDHSNLSCHGFQTQCMTFLRSCLQSALVKSSHNVLLTLLMPFGWYQYTPMSSTSLLHGTVTGILCLIVRPKEVAQHRWRCNHGNSRTVASKFVVEKSLGSKGMAGWSFRNLCWWSLGLLQRDPGWSQRSHCLPINWLGIAGFPNRVSQGIPRW